MILVVTLSSALQVVMIKTKYKRCDGDERKLCDNRELKQQRRERRRKRHLKININMGNVDYFVIIASSSHPLFLTEHAGNGLVEAPLK